MNLSSVKIFYLLPKFVPTVGTFQNNLYFVTDPWDSLFQKPTKMGLAVDESCIVVKQENFCDYAESRMRELLAFPFCRNTERTEREC